MSEIELGDKVRDIYSGFVGIAVSRTQFVNGCVQYGVIEKMSKKNQLPAELDIDGQSLEVISPKKKKVIKENNGGKTRVATKMRGF